MGNGNLSVLVNGVVCTSLGRALALDVNCLESVTATSTFHLLALLTVSRTSTSLVVAA